MGNKTMAKKKASRKKGRRLKQTNGVLPRDPDPTLVPEATRATSLPPQPLPAYEPPVSTYTMPDPSEPHNPKLDTSYKYYFHKNYSVPKEVAESGVIRLVGRERGESNRFLGGHGWVYSAVVMPNAQSNDEPSGSMRFHVRESELDKWGSQVVGPSTAST